MITSKGNTAPPSIATVAFKFFLGHAACGLIGLALLFSQTLHAETETEKINKIKAAFVLNIAKFITWPSRVYEQRPDRLMLCFYRHNPMGKALTSIDGRRVKERRLHKKTVSSLSEGSTCDILMVSSFELENLRKELRQHYDTPVLIVADLTDRKTHGVAYDGVQLSLVRKGKGIGFEVNLERVNRAGLKISSELLKLATIVSEPDQ